MLHVDVQPDLLRYIAAALGAFIVTLVIFFVGVRIQTCLMSRQQQQQRAVEMAVMASRPFATVNLEVSKSAPPDLVAECQNYQLVAAIEPCSDSKAGVMTVFLQLPMPDGDQPPFGQPRLALASTLVQLKHKKSEQRHRARERDPRERERVRETRAARENQEQSLSRSSRPTTPQLPALQLQNLAPLAPIPLDDDLPTPILPPDDVMHIRHGEAVYDNPAMV